VKVPDHIDVQGQESHTRHTQSSNENGVQEPCEPGQLRVLHDSVGLHLLVFGGNDLFDVFHLLLEVGLVDLVEEHPDLVLNELIDFGDLIVKQVGDADAVVGFHSFLYLVGYFLLECKQLSDLALVIDLDVRALRCFELAGLELANSNVVLLTSLSASLEFHVVLLLLELSRFQVEVD